MFDSQPLAIPDVKLITPRILGDDRGYFMETYHSQKFAEIGITDTFVQDNQSQSSKGILRGLHLQRSPKPQAKLVRVLSGEIYDVAVDIDPQSATFGTWVGERLTADTPQFLYIPTTCAHAFYVLSETAVVSYKCSDVYDPSLEVSIRWDDPDLDIDWPIDIPPSLSQKDQEGLSWKAFTQTL